MTTTVARLTCDEPAARRLLAVLGETLDADDGLRRFRGRRRPVAAGDSFPRRAGRRSGARAGRADGRRRGGKGAALRDARRHRLGGAKPGRPAAGARRPFCRAWRARPRAHPANAIGIEIEAALAFGTGHHGTTRGCLLALDDFGEDAARAHILDLGTGSGVLAIAAAKVFRTRVTPPISIRSRFMPRAPMRGSTASRRWSPSCTPPEQMPVPSRRARPTI